MSEVNFLENGFMGAKLRGLMLFAFAGVWNVSENDASFGENGVWAP